MKVKNYKFFSESEHATWKSLFNNLDHCRKHQAHSIFANGVQKLGLNGERIPDLKEVNRTLSKISGWQGIAVEGLEENESFFTGLANRTFPIGNFIRDARDINYTPAPDVFHDLYGHLPFFTDMAYAEFCQDLGVRAAKKSNNSQAMVLWGRLFWFGVEFTLIKTTQGTRIFGGGILSSFGESNYCLSDAPVVRPFSPKDIVAKDYKIDEFQKEVFILEKPNQLYECLDEYEMLVDRELSL